MRSRTCWRERMWSNLPLLCVNYGWLVLKTPYGNSAVEYSVRALLAVAIPPRFHHVGGIWRNCGRMMGWYHAYSAMIPPYSAKLT